RPHRALRAEAGRPGDGAAVRPPEPRRDGARAGAAHRLPGAPDRGARVLPAPPQRGQRVRSSAAVHSGPRASRHGRAFFLRPLERPHLGPYGRGVGRIRPHAGARRATGPFSFQGRAEVIGHRGFSAAAPENTLTAVEAALAAGADAVEFDLQVTADGTPVLLHDDTLSRTTNGRGSVRRTSIEAVGRLDAGRWFEGAFAGEPVPELERVLAAVGTVAPRLYPEIKGVRHGGDVDRIVDTVEAAGALDRTVFIAIDWDLLERVRARAPEAAIGYIVTKRRHATDALARAAGDPAALVDFDKGIPLRDPGIPARAREAGIEMAAWTVDDTGDADRLLALGIPRITTNQVARMVAWKAGLSPVE